MCEKKFPITTSKCEIDFLPLYNHVKENKGLAKEVFGNETGPMMRDHVKNIIIFALQSYLKNRLRSDVDKGLLPIMLESTGSALMAMLIGWSLKGMPVLPGLWHISHRTLLIIFSKICQVAVSDASHSDMMIEIQDAVYMLVFL